MGSGVYHIETIKVKSRATGNVVVQFRLGGGAYAGLAYCL